MSILARRLFVNCHRQVLTRSLMGKKGGRLGNTSKEKLSENFFQWKHFFTGSLFIGSGYVLFSLWKNKKDADLTASSRQSIGRPAIGGPFDLIDSKGNPCTSKDFLGKWILLYFGFTHCPDVCPEEIEKMVATVDKVDKKVGEGKLVPIIITVDPTRDTPEAMEKYVKEFSPKIIGLTGDKRAIDSVTKRYRVYYSPGPKDKDNDYIVDHTIIMYLIDDNGSFSDYFGQNATADEIADQIISRIRFG